MSATTHTRTIRIADERERQFYSVAALGSLLASERCGTCSTEMRFRGNESGLNDESTRLTLTVGWPRGGMADDADLEAEAPRDA